MLWTDTRELKVSLKIIDEPHYHNNKMNRASRLFCVFTAAATRLSIEKGATWISIHIKCHFLDKSLREAFGFMYGKLNLKTAYTFMSVEQEIVLPPMLLPRLIVLGNILIFGRTQKEIRWRDA